MSKFYISADIEGSCGIADWKETDLDNPQSAYFRSEMTKEVVAACHGTSSVTIGVSSRDCEIVVKDAHDSGRNIDPSALPENVRIMRSWTRDPYSMMAGLDGSFAGAMFIGYHSAAGTDGNPLAHTMNTQNVRVLVNGRVASEFLINAYTAALFGVPPILLTGDRALCESALEICPNIKTVAVSEGLGNASTSLSPSLAHRLIEEAAEAACRKASDERGRAALALELPKRFEVEIEYKQHYLAYRGSFYPGARKKGAIGLEYSSESWKDVLAFLYFVL
jgi:D-amino peptidase